MAKSFRRSGAATDFVTIGQQRGCRSATAGNGYNGTAFNGPNDLVIDSTGGIYFSDPDYENRHSLPEAVYYLSAQGTLTRLVTGFTHPNGVILSPDGKTFYLAVEGQKFIEAYDVVSPGVIANGRLFARDDVNAQGQTIPGITNGPDGLTIDPAGNIYSAVQNAVWAWNPQGQQLFELSFPEDPTNLDFGGADGRTLFVAAGTSLYSVQLNIVPEPAGIVLMAVGAVMVVMASRLGSWRRKRDQHVARRQLNAAVPWSLRFDPAKTTVQLTPFQTGVFKGGYGAESHELAMWLRKAYLAFHRRVNAWMLNHGITADQYVVLRVVAREPGITQIKIVERAASDPNTVAAILRLLEHRGLVLRQSHSRDRRARCVFLTAAGRKLQRRAFKDSEPLRAALRDCMTESEC